VPGLTETVLMYYLGGGFVILLGWAACHPDRQLDDTTARRYLRWTTIAGFVGLLHPALALAAKDIMRQVHLELPDSTTLTDLHTQLTVIVNALLLVSLPPAVFLLASTLI
jgi:hypothetical protein